MSPSKLLVEQLIHLYHSLLIHPLYESQNNKPDLFFADGNIRIVLLFVGFYSSHHELAYNYNILLFNPALLYFYFGLHKKKKWIYNFIQPTFLSGVLIYDDEQGSFINCVASLLRVV
jgi:hypothetical protein